MPRLSLGFNQRNFNGTRATSAAAINMGSMRGKGSTSRMFNFCKTHSPNPSECINQFINITGGNAANILRAPFITSINVGERELIVNFNAPNDGGSPITDYLYSIDANGTIDPSGNFINPTFISSGLNSSPIIIRGLTNNVTYPVAIKAVNSIGTGNASNIVSGTPTVANQGWSELGANALVPFTSLYTTTGAVRVVNYNQTLNKVYVAGDFKNSAGYEFVAVYDIASNVWSQLGNISLIISPANTGPIRALIFDTSNNVYIGGDFRNNNGFVFVAKYTNSTGQWSQLGNLAGDTGMSVNGSINCLTSDSQNRIYPAGNFQYTDTNGNWRYVARYTPNANTWDRLPNPNSNSIGGQQFNAPLYAIKSGETLQGIFIYVAGDAISTNGGGFDNPVGVRRVWVYYAEAGGFGVQGFGQWPPSSDPPDIYMFNGPVYALSDQIAGGAFTNDPTITATTNNYILASGQWNPYPLTPTNTFIGPTYNGVIRTITNGVYSPYVAGDFTNGSNNPYVAISSDGTQLGNQSTFFNDSILSISYNPSFDKLYAGGNFTNSSVKNFVAVHTP
jgi:hypothetical protein